MICLLACLLAESGSRPASRLAFLLVTEGRPQESKQRTPLLLPPSLRLRLRATCAVKLLRRCGLNGVTQVCPQRSCRDADGREALFAYFLTRQKVSRPPGRNPGVAGKALSLAKKQCCFDSYLRFCDWARGLFGMKLFVATA